MIELQLSLTPREAGEADLLKQIVARKLNVAEAALVIEVARKAIDARGRFPVVKLHLRVFVNETPVHRYENSFNYHPVTNGTEVIIVGAGPAGLFAALRLIELGIRPVVLERGKAIPERKKDIALLNRNVALDADSNYCFGEGGAGTFSDGKLYTRSGKRGNTRRILEIFHYHGAQDAILYEAHPHIGTDCLPEVVKRMRQTIIDCGGEIHFSTKVTDLLLSGKRIRGVITADGMSYEGKAVILATGHSARDVYHLLHRHHFALEAKGFAMGVRVEHPQSLIDSIQYKCRTRNAYLPAATYSLTHQANGRGVYSFCMCPGGHIVPSATEAGQVVVNGMSASHRGSAFANAGIVVEIRTEDLPDVETYGAVAGIHFQQHLERLSFNNNGGAFQQAPAQRLTDFVQGKLSYDLPDCSYLPGIVSSPIHFWLPESIGRRLQEGFKAFDRKMKGFLTAEAVVVGMESRSSSPVRILRQADTFEHPQLAGLYPCGEGSGYAGGITSSAMDGENCAEKVFNSILSSTKELFL
ncbi:MAG: FAD-dependent monooxygenase [Prevotellaceae bacterium]|jgi:uncharacterized FAD-dependent dehydrogenase|nr:FAD-dependent monooxygenase [Prevotellaceae bacterium]